MELTVANISVALGTKKQRKLILDDVSFHVDDGSFVSLLGASGAGKSTLLKIIAGVLVQDSGSILFNGVAVDDLPPHRRKLGFVFQDMRLFPNMTVGENVAFPCKMDGMGKAARRERADYLLERVQLAGFADREVRSLSGGQQQRVALARALAAKPHALLLDEPFSGLDENLRDDMRSLVLELQREAKVTTLMVTHDAGEALAMSDRIVYMSLGRFVQNDDPVGLFSRPASAEVAACFGDCSRLAGAVERGVFQLGDIRLPADGVPDGPAEAVVRYRRSSAALPDAFPLPEGLFDAGFAQVKSCQYRGDDTLAHLDVDGQELSVVVKDDFEPGARVRVSLAQGSTFVFPKPA